MVGQDQAQKIGQILRQLIAQQGIREAHLADAAGLNRSHLWKILNQKCCIKWEHVARLLKVLRYPESFFLAELYAPGITLGDIREVVARCLPNSHHANFPNPTAGLTAGLPDWLALPPTVAAAPTARELLLELNETWLEDQAAAAAKLETKIREILSGPRSTVQASDLALALALRAAIHRRSGSFAEARVAYLAALDLVPFADSHFVEGFVVAKAAYYLADFGRDQQALLLDQRALGAFGRAGNKAWQARVMVEIGVFHFGLRDLTEAKYWLECGLANLEPWDKYFRFSACEILADIYLETGRFPAALVALAEAEACCPQIPASQAYFSWQKGRTLRAVRDFDRAAEELVKALGVILPTSDPLDAAMLSLDLAAVYLESGKSKELLGLIKTIIQWHSRLKKSTQAYELLEDFLLGAYRGELTGPLVAETRKKLEAAAPPQRR